LAKEIAEKGSEILRSLGIDVSSEAILGKEIIREILKKMEDGNFDLIVVGSRGLSGIPRFLLGSAALKLINRTSRPILVYKHVHHIK